MTAFPDIQAVVTDIEGTITPLSFVRDVLFPYAREHLAGYVNRHADDPAVRAVLDEARHIEKKPLLDRAETVSLLLQWGAEDRKIKPLKTLQGMIWEAGYKAGAFAPPVYDDAVAKLREWYAAGVKLYVYSSGSVAAQKLLFRHATQGDLTALFSGYFDTAIGGKLEKESYAKIAAHIGKAPAAILFLSDHAGELDAARAAGFATVLVDRENAPHGAAQHPCVGSFSTITFREAA